MIINIVYEIKGLPGLVIDSAGNYWRMPFTSTNNKKYPAKKMEPVYERNYYGIRWKNTVYSDKYLKANIVKNAFQLHIDE